MAAKVVLTIIVLVSAKVADCQSVGVKGPPHAEQRDVQRVAHIGENVKLVCPIGGHPTPMVEWSKDGEIIDFMWERYRSGRKALKIRNANEDDTGIFVCKGVNGFGSATVRVELIVVDPRSLPDSLRDDSLPDVAPPVFTHETRAEKSSHTLSVGDTFRASCEALGSPRPEIFWFKDGEHINEAVRYEGGKSVVEFSVLGPADGGIYTCRARNLVGERTVDYSLKVRQSSDQRRAHAVVSAVGPRGGEIVVGEGEDAILRCRIKSITVPTVKWLKKIEGEADEVNDVGHHGPLKVGEERYKVLEGNREAEIGRDEHLSTMVVPGARKEDSGVYTCFVTNTGFVKLTYASISLNVVEGPLLSPATELTPIGGRNGNGSSSNDEPLPLFILAVVLAAVVVVLIICIFAVVVRKLQLTQSCSASSSSSKSPLPSTAPDTPEVQRPFINGNSNNAPSTASYSNPYHLPMPPTTATLISSSTSNSGWGRRVHPNKADSGLGASPKEREPSVNQYEVPYAHLMRQQQQGDEIPPPSYAFVPPIGVYRPTTTPLLQAPLQQGGKSLSDKVNLANPRFLAAHRQYFGQYDSQ